MTDNILAEIQQIEVLKDVPEAQCQWLIDHAELIEAKEGEYVFHADDPARYMYILLEGKINFFRVQNKQQRLVATSERGMITGLLPYSRMERSGGDGVVSEKAIYLRLHRDHFPELERECPDIVRVTVGIMTSRVREFTKSQQQNEKLMALGKLSAGLAHELNNPASAIKRSSSELKKHLGLVPERFKQVMTIRLSPEQVDAVNNVLFSRIEQGCDRTLTLMEKTAIEDDISDWLEDHGVEDGFELAETLVEFGLNVDDMEGFLEQVSEEFLPAVIRWIDNVLTTEKLVLDIESAANRISDLVGSVKTYSHMDRGTDKEMVDLLEGVKSTLTMLNHKLKRKNIQLVEEYEKELPKVHALPGELNQVWTNLIDNATDAMEEGGVLTIKAYRDGQFVKVDLTDNGSGIPEEVLTRIFEPFFTTKDVGQGTGLGLDIVKKIIDGHNGDIKVASRPGQTTFTVCLPINEN